jgi:hypothetical protein
LSNSSIHITINRCSNSQYNPPEAYHHHVLPHSYPPWSVVVPFSFIFTDSISPWHIILIVPGKDLSVLIWTEVLIVLFCWGATID